MSRVRRGLILRSRKNICQTKTAKRYKITKNKLNRQGGKNKIQCIYCMLIVHQKMFRDLYWEDNDILWHTSSMYYLFVEYNLNILLSYFGTTLYIALLKHFVLMLESQEVFSLRNIYLPLQKESFKMRLTIYEYNNIYRVSGFSRYLYYLS